MKTFPHEVKIPWTIEQGTAWWNECCAMVLEVFGLPGDRFMYHPHIDHMVFNFETKNDELLCRVLLSDRL